MLRFSWTMASVAVMSVVGASGCAARVQGGAQGATACVPVDVQGGATAAGSWQGGGQAQGSGQAQGGGAVGTGWTGGGQAQGGGQVGGQAGGQVGGQAGGQVGGGVGGGWKGEGSAGGGVAVAPWAPVFFGIPLAGAQDVVFVLDHSGSMSEGTPMMATTGAINPFAAVAAVGLQAMSVAQAGPALLPALSVNGGWSPAAVVGQLGPSKMTTAKSELMGALAALPDGTRFNIVFFNENVSAYAPRSITMSPSVRLNSLGFVRGIGPDGTTAAVPALRTAYLSTPSRVMFLSDGLANTGGSSQQLLAEARLQMRRGVRFDTVGVGSDQDEGLMRSLSGESGGQYVRR